ncbi:tetratricopeptide repeat protein [Rheinheimera baltica]|uniref:tetratricopeptide repeat protein n=1 Tax=Rheinheimera baltica TaxID=67576 RepID=UPI00273E6435|nr:tetratricopeptide repeat protein [Rheinheimera baltica]MDP5189711.1 GDSL-type esterase/lipase family protein [Rheinheimera baltica]
MMHYKRPLFYFIALLLPILILGLAELGLRATGYGNSYPLFIPSQHSSGYIEPNQQLIQRYFAPGKAPKLSMDTQLVLATKPADSFRIVVQGGSTAAGFPYGRWGSLQALLQQRFKRSYPEKNIEVINTAMAAINSYSLLDFQAEIVALQPDLVLVYTGHNEFLGLLGAGSALSVASSRGGTLLYLKLRNLRLFQLMQSLLQTFSPTATADTDQRSLMAKIAQGADIASESPLYQETLKQFQQNLALLLQGYQQAKIPVMLSTLVSNERDLVPFSAIGITDWQALTQQLSTSATLPSAVLQHKAAYAFVQGLQALQQDDAVAALAWLKQARDDDSLRFRAPSAFNSIIRSAAHTYHATLVDTEQLFRQHSTNGIVGNSLLLEHVHPTAQGYSLLAEAFYQAIRQSNMLGGAISANHAAIPEVDIPLTELDQRYAALKITNLMRQYPFRQPDLPPVPFEARDALDKLVQQRLAGVDWLSTQQALIEHYLRQQDIVNASKAMAMLADALPFDALLWRDTGMYYMQLQQLQLANYYLHHALQLAPGNVRFLLPLAQLYFMQQRLDDSLLLLQQAKKLAPTDPRIQRFTDKVTQAKVATLSTHKK